MLHTVLGLKTQPDLSLHSSIKHFSMDSVQGCLSNSSSTARCMHNLHTLTLHTHCTHLGCTASPVETLSVIFLTQDTYPGHLFWPPNQTLCSSICDHKPIHQHREYDLHIPRLQVPTTVFYAISILMAVFLQMGNYLQSLLPYRKSTISGLHGHPQKLLRFIFIICIA